MSRCVKPRQEWGRGQNTRMGGSDPTAPRNRGPVPAGFGGHSRLLLLGIAARVLAARRGSSDGVVRQPVIQNRKGGSEKTDGDHQSTTQATQGSNDPGSGRGIHKVSTRQLREVHRLLYVIRHHRGSKTPVQARRRVQDLARPTIQKRQLRTTRRRRLQ